LNNCLADNILNAPGTASVEQPWGMSGDVPAAFVVLQRLANFNAA
jgi:hypothetical protein